MENLSKLLLIAPTAFLIACSTQSGNTEPPQVRIPNLPPSVKYTEPKLISKAAKNANDTRKQLENYENANKSNKIAIDQARAHNRKLQQLYNKEPKKEPEDSNWLKNPLTSDWKLW